MNGVAALYWWQKQGTMRRAALIWAIVAGFFVIMSPLAMSGHAEWTPGIPAVVEGLCRCATPGRSIYSVGTTLLLVVMFIFRRFFVQPDVAWTLLNLSLLLMGAGDDGLRLLRRSSASRTTCRSWRWCFCWASSRGWRRPGRWRTTTALRKGLPPLEKLDDEKVLVWPDLVYTELICMIALTAILLVWAIVLQAPLEEPASSVKTPNPSKAPWYFLGLQEMLVYYDPWKAGVVLPSLIIFGLMAIPFLDFNKQGERLLHDRRAEVQLSRVSVRLSGAVGDADHAGDVSARAELELLRAV